MSNDTQYIIVASFAVYTAKRVGIAIRDPQSQMRIKWVRTVKQLHWRMILRQLPWLAMIAVAIVLLLQIPGLSIGWWGLLGGSGNVATGSGSGIAV